MRPTKSRSRNKPNRSRSVGNVVNRVFDSSGPEGKVRGTPQQIIEKYNQLARDAQLSNDRVAAENFQQHAEHYLRLLGEAQKEQDAKREQLERENRERQADRDRERLDRQEREAAASIEMSGSEQPDVIERGPIVENDAADSGLVETPECKPAPVKRPPRKPRAKPATDKGTQSAETDTANPSEAAE